MYICVDMDEHVAMWQLSPLVLIATYWDKDFAVLIRIKGTKNEMRGNRKLDAKKRLTDREMESQKRARCRGGAALRQVALRVEEN